MPENDPKIVFKDNTNLHSISIPVDFEKMTLMIRKCLHHKTSDDKCAIKQHIKVQFLHLGL